MEVLSRQLRQNVFGQLYQENMEKGKPYTIPHFVAMTIPRRTIYRIIYYWRGLGALRELLGVDNLPLSCRTLQGSGWQRPQATRLT